MAGEQTGWARAPGADVERAARPRAAHVARRAAATCPLLSRWMAAVAVADVAAGLTADDRVTIKWPNDVLAGRAQGGGDPRRRPPAGGLGSGRDRPERGGPRRGAARQVRPRAATLELAAGRGRAVLARASNALQRASGQGAGRARSPPSASAMRCSGARSRWAGRRRRRARAWTTRAACWWNWRTAAARPWKPARSTLVRAARSRNVRRGRLMGSSPLDRSPSGCSPGLALALASASAAAHPASGSRRSRGPGGRVLSTRARCSPSRASPDHRWHPRCSSRAPLALAGQLPFVIPGAITLVVLALHAPAAGWMAATCALILVGCQPSRRRR